MFLMLLFWNQFASSQSQVQNKIPKFVDGSIAFDFDTSFFKTSENFDADGKKNSLASDNSFQIIDVSSNLRWGMFTDFGVYTGFNIGVSESANSIAVRKNSSLSDFWIGADYRFLSFESFELFAKFTYVNAVETYDSNTDTVMNTNGVNQIIPEVGIKMPTRIADIYGLVGYNQRSGGFSSLLPYNIGAEFKFSNFGLKAGIDGYASVSDDKETAQALQREIVMNRVNAGSKKFYSVNPNEMMIDTALSYAFSDSWNFRGFFKYSIIGSNSAAGWVAGAGLTWEMADVLKGTKERIFKPKNNSNLSRDPLPSDFTENTEDGVNQQYFQQVPPPTKPATKVPIPNPYANPNQNSSINELEASQQQPDEDLQIKTKRKDELKIRLKRKK